MGMTFAINVFRKGVLEQLVGLLGLDVLLLEQLKEDHEVIVTLEDGILDGGFGEKIARFYGRSHQKVLNYGLQKKFLDRYDVAEVLRQNHLTAEQIAGDVAELLCSESK